MNLYFIYKSISKMGFLFLEEPYRIQRGKNKGKWMNPGAFLIVGIEVHKKNVLGEYTVNSAGKSEWRYFQNPASFLHLEPTSSSFCLRTSLFQIPLSLSIYFQANVYPGLSLSPLTSWITSVSWDGFLLSQKYTVPRNIMPFY